MIKGGVVEGVGCGNLLDGGGGCGGNNRGGGRGWGVRGGNNYGVWGWGDGRGYNMFKKIGLGGMGVRGLYNRGGAGWGLGVRGGNNMFKTKKWGMGGCIMWVRGIFKKIGRWGGWEGIMWGVGGGILLRLNKRLTRRNVMVDLPCKIFSPCADKPVSLWRAKQIRLAESLCDSIHADLKAQHQGIGIQQTRGTLEKRRNKQHLVDRERAAGRTTKWAGPKLLSRGADGNFREVNM
ncbi:hypothetical protein DPMN_037138 [Dreissena polymorpha]|uniref:Uncharacterized protein n=1 Tax=Dreissena polymorpha TaxID=45954 RepID=A0A9D4MEE4_DREPO|nr:hypothetical protein DPMN_037138 [Dreissena polymorpha]